MEFVHRLREKALQEKPDGAFFWIETGGAGEPRGSIMGEAHIVAQGFSGKETEFVSKARDILKGASTKTKFVLLIGYEFVSNQNQTDQVPNDPSATAILFEINSATDFQNFELTAETDGGSKDLDFKLSIPEEEYKNKVRQIKKEAESGGPKVVCLTNSITVDRKDAPNPFETFLRLRGTSLTNRTGYIEWHSGALLSATPERALSLKDGLLRSAPIKGTKARGRTENDDARLKAELLDSAKDKAELEAVIQSTEEDFVKICGPESIQVISSGHIESFPQVHQLVAEIEGKLENDKDLFDVIQSVFPMPSMTGSPKAEALNSIRNLEIEPRGWYSGLFGIINDRGNEAELAMTIRSIEYSEKKVKIGAGGGITADSNIGEEWQEVILKAEAMLKALANKDFKLE